VRSVTLLALIIQLVYYEYRNSLRVSFIRVTPFVRQWTDTEVSLLPLKGTGEDKSFVYDL
jgi:hypothetical protein